MAVDVNDFYTSKKLRRCKQEAPDFPSCHKCTKYTVTLGPIPSERNPENSWETLMHWVTEIPTSERVGKAETQLRHRRRVWHAALRPSWSLH